MLFSPWQGQPPPSAASGSSRGWSNTSQGAAPSSPIMATAATVGLGAEGSLWMPQTGEAEGVDYPPIASALMSRLTARGEGIRSPEETITRQHGTERSCRASLEEARTEPPPPV